MKKLTLLSLVFISTLGYGQKKVKEHRRYFEAMYFGQDSSGNIKYGTYFFSATGLPSQSYVKALIIVDYKLEFTPIDGKMALIVSEFKNKQEYDSFNYCPKPILYGR